MTPLRERVCVCERERAPNPSVKVVRFDPSVWQRKTIGTNLWLFSMDFLKTNLCSSQLLVAILIQIDLFCIIWVVIMCPVIWCIARFVISVMYIILQNRDSRACISGIDNICTLDSCADFYSNRDFACFEKDMEKSMHTHKLCLASYKKN